VSAVSGAATSHYRTSKLIVVNKKLRLATGMLNEEETNAYYASDRENQWSMPPVLFSIGDMVSGDASSAVPAGDVQQTERLVHALCLRQRVESMKSHKPLFGLGAIVVDAVKKAAAKVHVKCTQLDWIVAAAGAIIASSEIFGLQLDETLKALTEACVELGGSANHIGVMSAIAVQAAGKSSDDIEHLVHGTNDAGLLGGNKTRSMLEHCPDVDQGVTAAAMAAAMGCDLNEVAAVAARAVRSDGIEQDIEQDTEQDENTQQRTASVHERISHAVVRAVMAAGGTTIDACRLTACELLKDNEQDAIRGLFEMHNNSPCPGKLAMHLVVERACELTGETTELLHILSTVAHDVTCLRAMSVLELAKSAVTSFTKFACGDGMGLSIQQTWVHMSRANRSSLMLNVVVHVATAAQMATSSPGEAVSCAWVLAMMHVSGKLLAAQSMRPEGITLKTQMRYQHEASVLLLRSISHLCGATEEAPSWIGQAAGELLIKNGASPEQAGAGSAAAAASGGGSPILVGNIAGNIVYTCCRQNGASTSLAIKSATIVAARETSAAGGTDTDLGTVLGRVTQFSEKYDVRPSVDSNTEGITTDLLDGASDAAEALMRIRDVF